ncbi:hypothetical protein DSO57_1034386 [Entomophthora muscae]|uniref:Uncharacterized protein n=1 Tax=Entomophthora muscae TaxID=34485 RepID=A0ACC2RQS4_9FUNG|nr:hypothetical protein DSO57_1034386 [Entomophthora muscae]
MEPPITPKSMPVSAPELSLDHTNKLFGIVYITLTGVIDTIIAGSGLWSWHQSYGVLCLQNLRPVFPENNMLVAQGWFPDSIEQILSFKINFS